jgi:hypothetical protein
MSCKSWDLGVPTIEELIDEGITPGTSFGNPDW